MAVNPASRNTTEKRRTLSNRRIFLKYRLPAILWATVIFIGSSIPGKTLPPLRIFSWDKLIHICEFGIFGLLLARAFSSWPNTGKRGKLVTFAASTGILWALLDEVHQMFVPGRDASIYDFFADALGVIVAQVVFTQVWQRRPHRL